MNIMRRKYFVSFSHVIASYSNKHNNTTLLST